MTIRARARAGSGRALEKKRRGERKKSRACDSLIVLATALLWDSPRDRSRTNERPITTIIRTCGFKERALSASSELTVSLRN